jgi:predicted PurR-regulated permease PerM
MATPEATGVRAGAPILRFRPPRLRYVLLAGVGILLLTSVFDLLAQVSQVFLLTLFAILLAIVLDVPISLLARRMKRALATAITLTALALLVAAFVLIAWPTVNEQASQVADQAPRALDQAQSYWKSMPPSLTSSLRDQIGAVLPRLLPLAFGTLSVLGMVLLVVVLAIFLASEPGAYIDGFMRLVPEDRVPVARELLGRIGHALRGWTVGTLVAMAAVGALTAVGLLLLGVNGWLVLGVIAFFGEFVPYVGPVASAVPAVAVGLAQSPTLALYVALLFLGIQQVEGNLLQPLIMRRAVHVRPAVLLVGQLILGSAFGFLGLLVATPLVAILQIAVGYLYVERALGKVSEGG